MNAKDRKIRDWLSHWPDEALASAYIRQQCEEIQRGWTESQRKSRCADVVHAEIPEILDFFITRGEIRRH